MQVIFHTGAHCTDEERLLKSLLRNKQEFAKNGISVPGPGRYRTLLKEAFRALQTSAAAPDARDVLIDAILDDEVSDRLILSNAHFFGPQQFAFGDGALYPDAAGRMAQMQDLFHCEQIELFMAIRNPATFLPGVMAGVSRPDYADQMGLWDPRGLRWSHMIERLRGAVPQIALTVWCYEDSPLIWAQIIRAIAGLQGGDEIVGGFDLLDSIMTPEGTGRFHDYLTAHPNMSQAQQRRVISAFLDKYAITDQVEEELDLPGWTDELVDELTAIYDEDVQRIQHIPGVDLIAP